MNTKLAIIIGCIFILTFSVTFIATPSSASSGSFSVNVSHPSAVYKSQFFHVYMNATPGYSNYTSTIYLGAEYAIGLSSGSSTHQLSKHGYFEYNITAPNAAGQSIFVTIQTYANFGSAVVSKELNFTIPVYEPITLSAFISNNEATNYNNISVEFLLNGALVSTKVISLASGQSKEVSVVEPANLMNNGINTLQVKILNGSLFTGVKTTYQSTFYYGTPPNYNWIYYIAAVVVVFMGFLVLVSGKRKITPGQPKWRYSRKKKQQKI
jgi:hypothetical protein